MYTIKRQMMKRDTTYIFVSTIMDGWMNLGVNDVEHETGIFKTQISGAKIKAELVFRNPPSNLSASSWVPPHVMLHNPSAKMNYFGLDLETNFHALDASVIP